MVEVTTTAEKAIKACDYCWPSRITRPSLTGLAIRPEGRVFLFLETDDFATDYAFMRTNGVHFIEAPRNEPYGQMAVFEDICGNHWDLIEPKLS